MLSFHYSSPVEIHFGYGSRNKLEELAGRLGRRAFLVSDPAVARGGLFAEFVQARRSLFAGIWTGVEPNPSVQSVASLAGEIRSGGADVVVAIGGGSTMDAAKAACLVAAGDVPVGEYHAGRVPVGQKSLPLIAMPTTAGTGSEVTPVAVLTDPSRNVKAPIGGPALLPRVAVVDPEWTLASPAALTAATGMDALSHALEAYWSVHAQPICDAFAEKAAWLILGSLERAYIDGADRDAREKMSLGSLLAGMAFAVAKTAGVHACSYPLTQRFGLPHGVACALTLDAFLRYNAETLPEKLARLAQVLGFQAPTALADHIRGVKRRLKLPATLSEAGIGGENLALLVSESFHPNMRNNPRPMTPEDLTKLYSSLEEAI